MSNIDPRYTKPSMVEVSNIYAESLFEWFYKSVLDDGGDGSSTIVCKNYVEVVDWFEEWWIKNHANDNPHLKDKTKFFHDKHIYPDIISFHDSNECFSFTNNDNIADFFGCYVYIVREGCIFGGNPIDDNARKLIGIPKKEKK